jgi:NAD(P)-dependent dehydrogenase (short-subunit alcohol dehydrogenase family)
VTSGDQRVALVTGASRGIGLAIAERLAREGRDLVLTARDADGLAAAADRLRVHGGTVLSFACDLGDIDAVSSLVPHTVDALGRIDVLVNNGGMFANGSVADIDVPSWEQVVRVNSTAPIVLCQGAVAHMSERRFGRIINIASVAGLRGVPHAAAYAMTKAALVSLTRCLATEVARAGITVNCVAPGMIHTDMTDEFRVDQRRTAWALNLAPMRRWGQAAEVADAVAYFAAEGAGFTTGQVLAVDGGWSGS